MYTTRRHTEFDRRLTDTYVCGLERWQPTSQCEDLNFAASHSRCRSVPVSPVAVHAADVSCLDGRGAPTVCN